MKAIHDMGWIKGKGPRFEDGTVPDGMQELGAQIEGGQKSGVCNWDVMLGCRAEGCRDLETEIKGAMPGIWGT